MGVSYYRICEKSEEKNKDLSLRPQAREFFPPEYLLYDEYDSMYDISQFLSKEEFYNIYQANNGNLNEIEKIIGTCRSNYVKKKKKK